MDHIKEYLQCVDFGSVITRPHEWPALGNGIPLAGFLTKVRDMWLRAPKIEIERIDAIIRAREQAALRGAGRVPGVTRALM